MCAVWSFVFCFYKNHSKKSFYLSVESRAVSFRRSVEILEILMETLIEVFSSKTSAFDKNTSGCSNISDDNVIHLREKCVLPPYQSAGLFFCCCFCPFRSTKFSLWASIQRCHWQEQCKVHTQRPQGIKPATRGWCNDTLPLPQASEVCDWLKWRETSEEIRRSEVTQTEPDKVTTEVTRFASPRSYVQRFIYILRGSFEGVQVAQRQCLSLASLKVFTACVWFVHFNFLKAIFISKYPPTFWTLDLSWC